MHDRHSNIPHTQEIYPRTLTLEKARNLGRSYFQPYH